MRVTYGQVCPDGFLPAYSVDTEDEAKKLMTFIPMDVFGNRYAEELYDEKGKVLEGGERIDAFVRFAKKLERIHRAIK